MSSAVSYKVIRNGSLCPACVRSRTDSRVVRHNLGLVLGVKDHSCSDTVCRSQRSYL